MQNNVLAAIDLGANSFHLSIVTVSKDGLRPVITSRDILHFNRGIDEQGQLHSNTRLRALKCLARFHDLLQQHNPQRVRAVGTSSFRQLGIAHAFIAEAEAKLGFPIEILSGEEEAKLIYQGATSGLPQQTRLVVDIGGGSTELALGSGTQPDFAVSLPVGSAQLSEAFFNQEQIHSDDIAAAKLSVQHELANINWQPEQWLKVEQALGTSGTVKAIRSVLTHLKLTQHDIELAALQRLEPVLWQVSNRTQLSQLLGLNTPRTRVFPGGFIILRVLFEWFEIPKIELAHRALREGILVNLSQSS